MGKVLKIGLIVAAVAVNVIPGAGQAISGAIVAGLGGTFAAAGIAAIAAPLLATAVTLAGVSSLAKVAGLGPKKPPGALGSGVRSRVSLDPNVGQWLVVGETATPAQLIYFGTSGATNERLSMIFVHACSPIAGFSSLALNNIATPFAPVTGAYAGILTIQTTNGTQTANPFTGVEGGRWGATHIGRGLAMSHFHWVYNAEKLTSGLPQNLQFVVRGIAVYDPRRDSTRGGVGAMRADDQSTWAYSVAGNAIGRNPALVEMSYRLGWKKGARRYAGMGEDPANLDYASYIAAANVCDETVGGKPRYRIDTLLPIGPDTPHNDNLAAIHATCGAKTSDTGGLIGIWVANDDTASTVMTLTDDDWFGDVSWEPLPEGEQRNTGRGSFIKVADGYLAAPYPEVAPVDLRALDNQVERADSLDFGGVQDVDQARRLVSIRLRESRQGIFTAPTSLRALGLRPMQVVSLNRPRIGWVNRRFRVEAMALQIDQVQLTLRAIQSSDYADVANTPTVVPGEVPTLGYINVPGVVAFADLIGTEGLLSDVSEATRFAALAQLAAIDAMVQADTVNQKVVALSASVRQEYTRAIVDGLSAEATARLTVEAKANANAAQITVVDRAYADITGAQASQITSLSARIDEVDGDGGALATAVSNLTTRVGNAEGVNTAQSTALTTLSTTVGGNTSTITSQQTSIDGVLAKAGLRLDVNGHITGYQTNNNGTVGDFIVTADKFAIVDPATTGPGQTVFEVSGGTTRIRNLLIGGDNIFTDNMVSGTTGWGSFKSNANTISFSSTTVWVAIFDISLTPREGYPCRGEFFMFTDTSGSGTNAEFQIRRDDGTVVSPVDGGSWPVRVEEYGGISPFKFYDSVSAGRPTTWTLWAKKIANSQQVTCKGRTSEINENPRGAYQYYDVVLPAGGGGGPGGGPGGGGQIP